MPAISQVAFNRLLTFDFGDSMASSSIFANAADKVRFEQAYNNCIGAGDADAKLVASFDLMMDLLKSNGLIDQMRLPPHRVGVHPDNRDGKAMSGQTMQSKCSKIVHVGCSQALCGPNRAVCFELPSHVIVPRMKSTVQTSKFFGNVSETCSFGSVGCSHWNQFLHALKDGAETDIEALKVHGGTTTDTHRLFSADSNLKYLATEGLVWSVVAPKVGDAYKRLPDIFQKALNTEHHVAEGETWDQQLAGASKLAVLNIKTTGAGTININWEKVATRSGSQTPHAQVTSLST